jgi:2-amino-4-hydroxy-6-hydroxymethyldihydropteridine diphosphokinase
VRAYVGIGSNLGDRWKTLALAAERLRADPRVEVVRASRVYDAAPMGPPQPRYLNAVLELETRLAPQELLALLQEVERAGGRTRGTRWGARTLDLDLLLHGNAVVRTPELVVPHPGLVSRRFVLEPLDELCPDLVVPGMGVTVHALTAAAPPFDLEPAGPFPPPGP